MLEKRKQSSTPVQRPSSKNDGHFFGDITGSNIRRTLLSRTNQARRRGQIYWDWSEVVDRTVNLDGLAGKVRYIPSFAYRYTLYEARSTKKCPLCEGAHNQDKIIPLPPGANDDNGFTKRFQESFVVHLNNFPYLDGQMLLVSRQHRAVFTDAQYKLLVEFMERTHFKGAAMQLEGSGATIPEHVHLSIFNEKLPIFSSAYRPIKSYGEVVVSIALTHPSVCYRLQGGSTDSRCKRALSLLRKLDTRGLSFNLYIDAQVSIYIIPRTDRRSVSANMKVGLSLPAGMYNGYVEQPSHSDVPALKEEIRRHCDGITSTLLLMALRETTLPRDEALSLLP